MPGKKIWGRKGHIQVDTQGFVLAVKVPTATIADRKGALLLLTVLQKSFPLVSRLFADRRYTEPLLQFDAFGSFPELLVRLKTHSKGFVLLCSCK